MVPSVVDESLVQPFKYWDKTIQKGIFYNQELYIQLRSFAKDERLKAYEAAFEQSQQGVITCISVSPSHYTIWLRLRSLNQNLKLNLQPAEMSAR
ncbi:hypothetical protein [Leptolyngbya sp. KIOST-1]|uniref:hypothetical protein n=1 Tax=Leptolyngbya sp. KIOST-1 TaxID=1229172 RepID=UPI00068C2355|nr:hypothetical protein [Leptolyngbya sp. KIOST-1]